jgi:2-C-methyl-D-erythritol 4-phosphate cytidylyltransferase
LKSFNEYAIIVAGGKGTRMQSTLPKQFLSLGGKPVLLYTLEAFYNYSNDIKVILVLPEEDFNTWKSIVEEYQFNKPYTLQKGGNTRFQSVKNGLEKIEGEGLVAIHDGVRPLVSTEIITRSFQLAAIHQSAIASMPLKESIRIVDGVQSKSLDRSLYRLIQTPQTFDVALIKEAYQVDEDESLTDDASVAERAGQRIHLFEGGYENIKITTQEDLVVAEAILHRKNKTTRR